MIKIKVPIKDVEKADVCGKVEEKLKSDKENGYTISGLMIELFGVKGKEIDNRPFRDWPDWRGGRLPSLYTKIRLCLDKLRKEGKVKIAKHGKAWIYWWA